MHWIHALCCVFNSVCDCELISSCGAPWVSLRSISLCIPVQQLGDVIYANSSELCLLIFFACTSVVVSWVTNHRSHRILDWTIFCMSAILYFFLFNVISFCSDTCFLLVEYLLQNETSSSCSLLSLMEERKQRRNKCFYGSGCLLWCGKTLSCDLK